MDHQYPAPEEWPVVRGLQSQLTSLVEESGATPAGQAYAAIMTAAR